jgi:hypothetical protein
MSSVLVLEAHDPHEEDICLLTRMAEKISWDQVGSTTVRPTAWDPAPAADVWFGPEYVVRRDRAVPDDGEKAFHNLLTRGATLKAESVAVIEQAHRVQAQSRALLARSSTYRRSRLFGLT